MAYKSKTWMEFLKKSKEMFDNSNIKITDNHDKEIIFIEPIDTTIMCEYVIKNAMYFLHDGWNLTIMHGMKNEKHFQDITKNLGKIKLINLGNDGFYPHPFEYNNFLISKKSYDMIEKDIFVIIQLDVIILKKIPDLYLNYSYVGAPWAINYGVSCGNGGFSLRNKKDMLKIIDKFNWRGENEDRWFSIGCKLLNLNLCPKDLASLFSSETIFNIDSCGIHKPHFGEDKLKLMFNNVKW
tara:strand:+ start:3247 stop:3963 length:717 start_codon:yes stop_codon:yes gene_type:complete